jgi:hypothetical protein
MSNDTGMFLIIMGIAAMISAYSPDKTFGLSLGFGMILLGLCCIDWRINTKSKDEL